LERILVLESPYDERLIEQKALRGYAVERVGLGDLREREEGVTGLIVDMLPIDAALLDRLPDLRAISVTGIGLDAIDRAETARRGIRVDNVPAGSTEEVATHAVALLLALVRKLPASHRHVAAGGFRHDAMGPIRRLSTLTVGIVGVGRIGRAVADRLAPFGATLVGWDAQPVRHPGVESVSLDELCARADAVTLHLPLDDGTLDLFDASRLESLRPGALLVNTGRGKLVDTDALIRLLRAGRLGGVALDVFRDEPPRAELELLEAHENVLATPHSAFFSVESEEEIRRTAARNLEAALQVL
jgi:D-3-phosphoglycerate dehydrogenase